MCGDGCGEIGERARGRVGEREKGRVGEREKMREGENEMFGLNDNFVNILCRLALADGY
jgi:hypothetical protein